MAETNGKAQKAPSQRVQEEGMLATGRKGVQQGGETKTKLEPPEDPGKRQQEKVEGAKKPPWPGY